jgi:hypothetical protein
MSAAPVSDEEHDGNRMLLVVSTAAMLDSLSGDVTATFGQRLLP